MIRTAAGAAGDLLNDGAPRTWDGRLARRIVTPLKDTSVTPNHLTTVRLVIGLGGAGCLAHGGYGWANAGALLIVLSNFVDHTDGELARLSGRTSWLGHVYDLVCDSLITVLLFACLGAGLAHDVPNAASWSTAAGLVAGIFVALIFFVRMRLEAFGGKHATTQSFLAGFETEDVLYLLPLVTLTGATSSFLIAAAIGAPLFAVWVVFDWWRVRRRGRGPESVGS